MNLSVSWKLEYQNEIEQAVHARSTGNEGMARVCARRAVGIIIGEFLTRSGVTNLPHSAYARISIINDLPDVNQQCKEIAGHFLMKVTTDLRLLLDVDLISEAMWLEKNLLNDLAQ